MEGKKENKKNDKKSVIDIKKDIELKESELESLIDEIAKDYADGNHENWTKQNNKYQELIRALCDLKIKSLNKELSSIDRMMEIRRLDAVASLAIKSAEQIAFYKKANDSKAIEHEMEIYKNAIKSLKSFEITEKKEENKKEKIEENKETENKNQDDKKEKVEVKDENKDKNTTYIPTKSEIEEYAKLKEKGYTDDSPEMKAFFEKIASQRSLKIVDQHEKATKNEEKNSDNAVKEENEVQQKNDQSQLEIVYSGKYNKYINVTTGEMFKAETFKNKANKIKYIEENFVDEDIEYLFKDEQNMKKAMKKCDPQLILILSDINMDLAKKYIEEMGKGKKAKKENLQYSMKYDLRDMKKSKIVSFFDRFRKNKLARDNSKLAECVFDKEENFIEQEEVESKSDTEVLITEYPAKIDIPNKENNNSKESKKEESIEKNVVVEKNVEEKANKKDIEKNEKDIEER